MEEQSKQQKRTVKIYTKTGDKGSSSLFNGERKSKSDRIFEALGNTDEVNNSIGVAKEFCDVEIHGAAVVEQLEKIQSLLFDVGASIATPRSSDQSSETRLAHTTFDMAHVTQLETWIDSLTEELSPLRNFILPSGGKASAFLHVARGVCRRAERSTVELVADGVLEQTVGIFLNR